MNKNSFDFLKGEVLLINKPYKWTSFDVVGKIRGLIKSKTSLNKIKIGHAGTLDPLATGLLILCTGNFTKKIEEFQALEKEYTGTFTLGATTPSFDLETSIDRTFDTNHITSSAILQIAKKFTGTFKQTPPQFSAKKIAGERAYEYARRGQEIEIKPNYITISVFEITNINLQNVEFRIVCSKGTYIRSLAKDFGEALKCGAHLTSLCRTRIGSFKLEQAIEINEFEQMLLSLP